MANTEDYLDGLLDSITQAKTEKEKPAEGRARKRRSQREDRRSRIRPDDDFLEANGLRSYRENEDRERRERRTEEDFLRSFEQDFSKEDADDLIRSFERELNEEDSFSDEDMEISDPEVEDVDIAEDMSPADSILANIEGIVSKAKRVASGEEAAPEPESTEQTEIPTSPEEEPSLPDTPDEVDLSAQLDENGEVSLLGEESKDMDLMDMLSADGDGTLTDIGDLLASDENADELSDAREAFDAAADGMAEGGEGLEAGEGGESPEPTEGGGEEEGEPKPNIIQKILGAIGGIFKKKEGEDEEDEDDEDEEDEEDGEGKETKEEKKARLKKEKEEAKKKKKEEADAKKKAKEEEKKKKDEEKKKKAAEKAAKPKKQKPKKPKERSPKIPIPVMIIFVFFSISLIASTRIMENAFGHQRLIADATEAYEKQDYIDAYRTLAGKKDLDKSEAKLRNKAKLMAYMQIKQKEYTICMNSGKETESGLDRYDIRTNYQMALDSLIAAVYFFQENEEKANELGITEEYTKYGQHLEKLLDKKFHVSVGEAVDLYRNYNRKSYTAALQTIIRKAGLKETY